MSDGRFVTRSATPVVDANSNGLIDAVADSATVEVSDMSSVSVLINQLTAPVLNRKAMLDMLSITTHIDTVVRAKVAGVGGEAFSVAIVMDAVAKAGSVDLVGSAYTFHLDPGVSQVSDFETLVTSTANLEVGTAGTAATLIQVGDAHAATNLTGGTSAGTFSMTVEKSADTVNWVAVQTLTQADFATGYVNDAVEITLSDANGMPTRARQVRTTLTALESTTSFTMTAAGQLALGY